MDLKVDERKRRLTMNNHSATHLLHAALRQVLGKHVEQKGSLVSDQILRFDFSHFAAMTGEEIEKVESIVNDKIRENIALDEQRNVPLEKAKAMGAMALFGEKYGEYVRVITFDPQYSVELCGGTHVKATGNIGFLKIVSESSVAAGVRRIEAVTGDGAREYVNRQLALLHEVRNIMRNPKDLVAAVGGLVEERQHLEKMVAAFNQERANQVREQLATTVRDSGGVSLIMAKVSLPDADAVKNVAYGLRNQFENLLLVLAAEVAGKPMVAVMIGEKLAQTQKYHAGNMVKELAREIDGGGGGQPFYATAGGKNLNGLDQVLVKAGTLIS
jgi:alanyl-tRNA synthetase